MKRRLTWWLSAVAVVLGLRAGTASAFDLCSAVTQAGAGLPLADAKDPAVRVTLGVWKRMYGAFHAVTGRATEIVITAPSAAGPDGAPLPPYAAMCEGPRGPRLILTDALLALLKAKNRYDEGFIALIIGHELGHRLRHFDAAGRWSEPTWTRELEEIADAHGAFWTAVAGYSTRQLACDDVMDLFLAVEAHVAPELRAGRKQTLGRVLRAFDVYESLYDAASALVFADPEAAVPMLEWVAFHLEDHARPIAEFYVLQALARLSAGLAEAPWWADVGPPGVDVSGLRCVPIYPGHTALWDERLFQLADDVRRTQKLAGYAKIRKALKTARRLGASAAIVESARGCLELYSGRYDAAETHFAAAAAAADPSAPAAISETLTANRALTAYAAWVSGYRHAHGADMGAWSRADKTRFATALRGAAPAFSGRSSALDTVLSTLRRYPVVSKAPSPGTRGLVAYCPAGAPPTDIPGRQLVAPMPAAPRAGGCPCGWSLLHVLDTTTDAAETVPPGIVATCIPAGWGVGVRYVDADLRSYGGRRRLLINDAPRGPLASLASWFQGCTALSAHGTTDRGERVFVGACDGLGAPTAVVTSDASCTVTRVVTFESAQPTP